MFFFFYATFKIVHWGSPGCLVFVIYIIKPVVFAELILTMCLWCLNREVSIEEGEAKSREFGVLFIETSAKAGFNIKVELFTSICVFLLIPLTTSYNSNDIFSKMQPLFRKIAAALPGMETLSSTKQEDMVDVNLKPTVNASKTEQQSGGCAC